MLLRKTLIVLALGFLPLMAQNNLPDKPEAWVTDYARVLSAVEIGTLNEMLAGLERRSSNQIFIAIFNRMPENYYLEDFTVRLYEKWRPGLPDKDNGILVVIFIQDRKIRIEVGYGLEDVITDAQAGRLIRDYITPEFKQGNYYQGLKAVLSVLIPAVEGKYILPQEDKQESENGFPLSLLISAFIIFIVLSRIFRGPRSSGYGTRRRSAGWFLTGLFLGGFGSGRGGGSGGFSGGGFGGGFGGMSGGGGASGSW